MYSVEHTKDEFGTDRYFLTNTLGDWEGDPFDNQAEAQQVAEFRNDLIRKMGCCEKAYMLDCVCAYSFRCPEHGDKHIGTHD